MKYEISVELDGQGKGITVEASAYMNQLVYQVTIDGDIIIFYKQKDSWLVDQDHRLNGEWLSAIGKAIEETDKPYSSI